VGDPRPQNADGRLALRMGVLDRILRAGEGKKLKALEGLIPDISALEAELRGLGNEALAHKTVEFRERLARGETLDDLLVVPRCTSAGSPK